MIMADSVESLHEHREIKYDASVTYLYNTWVLVTIMTKKIILKIHRKVRRYWVFYSICLWKQLALDSICTYFNSVTILYYAVICSENVA